MDKHEKWFSGKVGGCVVSNIPNRHCLEDDHVDYYGGYLIAESIPEQEYISMIARSPSMLALLETALPIIEEEANRRDAAPHKGRIEGYYSEMRDLATEISAEIERAKGEKEVAT